MRFDVQILIGVLLSLGSIRMIFVMRKLEKERIHDHKKGDVNEKREFGRKDFFLLFFGLFICTVGGSLLDSCIKLYKVNKIYTDTCTVKCTDYEYSNQYEDNSSDDYNRSYYYVLCIFTYTGNYNGVNISYKSQDTMSCMPEKGLDLRVKDLKMNFG